MKQPFPLWQQFNRMDKTMLKEAFAEANKQSADKAKVLDEYYEYYKASIAEKPVPIDDDYPPNDKDL